MRDRRVVPGRRSARAIVIDDAGRLVLIRRVKPGQPPYWTTPGGGVEDADATVESAMRRELYEELGATAAGASRVFLSSYPTAAGVAVQHFFLTRLASLDLAARTGPEVSDPARGGYELDLVDLRGEGLAAIDLRPAELKAFLLANREALLAEVAGVVPGETGQGKLVRDKIPDLIRADGLDPIIETAGPLDYARRLREKLREEVAEFIASDDDPGELADILEVLYALAGQAGIGPARLEELRAAKAAERGGFAGRLVWLGNRPAGQRDR